MINKLMLLILLFSFSCQAKKNYTEYKPKGFARHPPYENKKIIAQDYYVYRHYLEAGRLIFEIEAAQKYGGGPAEKKIVGISVCKFGEEKAVWFVRDDIEMGSRFKKIVYGVEPEGMRTRVKPESLVKGQDYYLDIEGYDGDGGEIYYFRYE